MKALRLIPQDGTFDQTKPLSCIRNRARFSILRSFDLSSATDRFPLSFQGVMVESLFTLTAAFAWVFSGLGVNVFVAPASLNGQNKYLRFSTGQPLGYLSSWPLFALAHHFVVWYVLRGTGLSWYAFSELCAPW